MIDEFDGFDDSPDSIEHMMKTLEAIAGDYDPDSPEGKALQEAAKSYYFVLSHERLRKAYRTFCKHSERPLSEFHLENLRGMGIDPNANEFKR